MELPSKLPGTPILALGVSGFLGPVAAKQAQHCQEHHHRTHYSVGTAQIEASAAGVSRTR